jgi:hypothetical protein
VIVPPSKVSRAASPKRPEERRIARSDSAFVPSPDSPAIKSPLRDSGSVRITKGTTEKNVSKEEAALRMMIEQSLQGDWKSFMALLKKGFKLGLIRRIQVPAFNSG